MYGPDSVFDTLAPPNRVRGPNVSELIGTLKPGFVQWEARFNLSVPVWRILQRGTDCCMIDL